MLGSGEEGLLALWSGGLGDSLGGLPWEQLAPGKLKGRKLHGGTPLSRKHLPLWQASCCSRLKDKWKEALRRQGTPET